MVSEKALYWISVGLLALVVTNNLATRHEIASRMAGTATGFAQRILDRGVRYATAAEMALSSKPACPKTQMAMVQTQVRMADLQAVMAREQAGMARLEGKKAQLIMVQEMKHATVNLRKQNFEIDVNDMPNISVDASF